MVVYCQKGRKLSQGAAALSRSHGIAAETLEGGQLAWEATLAASLGLSRLHRDDLAQLGAGMTLYDAFYRWSRDATAESHDWPAGRVQNGAP